MKQCPGTESNRRHGDFQSLCNDRRTPEKVALSYANCPVSVRSKSARAGVGNVSREDVRTIRALLLQGLKPRDVATITGWSVRTVRKLGHHREFRHWTVREDRQIRAMREVDANVRTIARALGRDYHVVQRRVALLGLAPRQRAA